MKKYIFGLALVFMIKPLGAVGVADIPAIKLAAIQLNETVGELIRFVALLDELSTNNFQIAVLGSTQTVTITNAQKQGLIARYQDLKTRLIADVNSFPQ